MLSGYYTTVVLSVVMGLVFFLPFSIKRIEEELEVFLFVMGLIIVTISGAWSSRLVKEALTEPVKISLAVLLIGFVFRAVRGKIEKSVNFIIAKVGLNRFLFLTVIVLGFFSSMITAIIASLVLCEVVSALKLERKYEIRLTVYSCFAIGLGAVLTPLGEPLSTIVIAKLRGSPHNADFFYLLRLLGWWIAPGVVVCAAYAAYRPGGVNTATTQSLQEDLSERNYDIVQRALKIYIFVMALVFLGRGLMSLANKTIILMQNWQLYWFNSVSAILDNATLAAAEIVPSLRRDQLISILLGLLISGGMLIPGNIPNIISASKLKIRSGEWARIGVPFGLVMLGVYFVVLMVFKYHGN